MDPNTNPATIPMTAYTPQTDDEIAVYNLYKQLLKSWNEQKADNYGALFTESASVIGFDGSQMNGNYEITEALRAIFANHRPNNYVSKVREIRFLTTEVVLLRAVAGMHPPGSSDIKPDVNAIQSLVAVKKGGSWRIALFQNTPAQFHGRPELSSALTNELQELLKDPVR
jgi:uncharacterized protein (TIGR02246 family)